MRKKEDRHLLKKGNSGYFLLSNSGTFSSLGLMSGRKSSQMSRLKGQFMNKTRRRTSQPGFPRFSASLHAQTKLQMSRPRMTSMAGMMKKIHNKASILYSPILCLFLFVRDCLFSVQFSINITLHNVIFFDVYMIKVIDKKHKIRKREMNQNFEIAPF